MPSHTLAILFIAVAAVGLFVLGLSLTLIFRGHHIDSEIATNRNMQRRGIRCAARELSECERADMCGAEECGGTGQTDRTGRR